MTRSLFGQHALRDQTSKVRFGETPQPGTRDARATQSFCARLFMARDSNAHSYGVDQIVTDQAGSDCDRKLGSGSRLKPMLVARSAGVRGEPATRSIE